MTTLGWILLGLFWLMLAAAAISDLRNLRISNLISLATFAAAITVLLFVRHDPGPWWHHLASFVIALAVGFGLFSLGWVGGGDAKLAAAAAVLFNLSELAWFAAATGIAGGILTLILMALRRMSIMRGGGWLGLKKGQSIPYGVAISAGAAIISAILMA